MPAVAAATPVKPKIPAMTEIMKNTSAQYSMNILHKQYSTKSIS